MATIQLPPDFKDFLRLLGSAKIEYLLVGGYAVGYYGYPRATGDMDIWVATHTENAKGLVNVLREFGFSPASPSAEMFLKENQVIRMGVPPLRIELLTSATGVGFQECHDRRVSDVIDGIEVSIIHLDDLITNKRAAGRTKDLNDLEHLDDRA